MELRDKRNDFRLSTHELVDQVAVVFELIAVIALQSSSNEIFHHQVGLLFDRSEFLTAKRLEIVELSPKFPFLISMER